MRVERLENKDELRAFLRGFGEDELPSESVQVEVLRDGEEVVGCVMSQSVKHVGPFYLKPEYLNSTAGGLLIRGALKATEGEEVHIVAMNERTEEMCQRFGMEKIEGSLWIRG